MDRESPAIAAKTRPGKPPESGTPADLPAPATEGAVAIARKLQKGILDGRYALGERLPPERELAIHFGVSRSTLREALRRLEELNLLSRRIGSGTFVNYSSVPDVYAMAQRISPLELIETREGIEPHLVRLAAINATGEDLRRLGEILERLEAAASDVEAFSTADQEFHLQLAESSRNPLMVWLYQQINSVRGNSAWNAMKHKILTPERILGYNREHRAIYEALNSRDIEGAVKIMQDHIERARRDLIGVA